MSIFYASRRFAGVLGAVVFLGACAHAAVDENRLRRVIPYPYLQIGYVFGDGGNGIALGYPKSMNRARLREAEATLKRSGEDGAICLQLSKLYWDARDFDNSHNLADRAEQIFRSQLIAHPDDPEILSSIAEAICLKGNLQGAVSYIDEITDRITDKWRLWVAESFVYRYAGYYYLLSRTKFARVTVSDQYMEEQSSSATKYPAAEDLTFAQTLFKTGTDACDKAVELAPDRPEVYANRATFKYTRDYILYLCQPHTADDYNSSFKITNEPTIIADYKYELDLNGVDDFAKIRVSNLTCLNILLNGSQLEFDQGKYWKNLGPIKKQIVNREVNNMLTLGKQTKDKILAAEVQSMLSLIYIMQGENGLAKTALRTAVTMDPDRQLDWERLTGLLVQSDDYATLAALTRTRLALADTLRNRLLLTVADAESGNNKDALAEFVRLQKDYPEEPQVHLLEIALLLERTNTPSRKAVLTRVGDLLNRYEDDAFAEKRDRESFTLLQGIYQALTGKTREARATFAGILKANPRREAAREALAALGA